MRAHTAGGKRERHRWGGVSCCMPLHVAAWRSAPSAGPCRPGVRAEGPFGAWSVFGFAARVRRAAARVIAESFGGKWLVETRDAAVLGLGLEQAVVEAPGLAAWSWACRVRWGVEGRRGREAGRLSARACWLVSAHGFLFFCLLLGPSFA